MLAQSDSSFSSENLKVVPFEHFIVHPMRRQVMYDTMYVIHMIFQAGLFYPFATYLVLLHNMSPSAGKMSPRLYECPLVKVLHC